MTRHMLQVELGRRADGQWTATVPSLPGVTASAATSEQALVAVHGAARRRLAGVASVDASSELDSR